MRKLHKNKMGLERFSMYRKNGFILVSLFLTALAVRHIIKNPMHFVELKTTAKWYDRIRETVSLSKESTNSLISPNVKENSSEREFWKSIISR